MWPEVNRKWPEMNRKWAVSDHKWTGSDFQHVCQRQGRKLLFRLQSFESEASQVCQSQGPKLLYKVDSFASKASHVCQCQAPKLLFILDSFASEASHVCQSQGPKGPVYVRNNFSDSKNFWKWFLHRAETFRICVSCWKTIFGDTLSSLRGRPQQPQYYQYLRSWIKKIATKRSQSRDLWSHVCTKITFVLELWQKWLLF